MNIRNFFRVHTDMRVIGSGAYSDRPILPVVGWIQPPTAASVLNSDARRCRAKMGQSATGSTIQTVLVDLGGRPGFGSPIAGLCGSW